MYFNTDVEFIDQSFNAVSYDWTLDDNGSLQSFNTNEFNYSFSVLQTGEYPICLNVTNEIGCSNLRCDTIKVEYPLLVYVPTGFTPLGLNNEFKPVIEYGALLDDYLFTGDTLLINGTGRTDFQNGSSKDAYNSLFNNLLKLPEETLVYPGHDYNGKFSSTIGNEKKFNPRLQVKSVDEYVDIMSNLNLARPKLIESNVSRNIQLGAN